MFLYMIRSIVTSVTVAHVIDIQGEDVQSSAVHKLVLRFVSLSFLWLTWMLMCSD